MLRIKWIELKKMFGWKDSYDRFDEEYEKHVERAREKASLVWDAQ